MGYLDILEEELEKISLEIRLKSINDEDRTKLIDSAESLCESAIKHCQRMSSRLTSLANEYENLKREFELRNIRLRDIRESPKKTWNNSMKEVGIDLDKAVEEEVRDEDTAEKKYRSEPELNRMNEELCGTDVLVERPDVFKIKEEVQKQTWGEFLKNLGIDIGEIPEEENDDH